MGNKKPNKKPEQKRWSSWLKRLVEVVLAAIIEKIVEVVTDWLLK